MAPCDCIMRRYRINNPGRVAEQYCGMMKCCLGVEDAWGSAANALEYAVSHSKNVLCGGC